MTVSTETAQQPVITTGDGSSDERAPAEQVSRQVPVAERQPKSAGSLPSGRRKRPTRFDVANCTDDHVIVSAGTRQLRLSPLGSAGLTAADVRLFALEQLAERQIVRVPGPEEATKASRGKLLNVATVLTFTGYLIALLSVHDPVVRSRIAWGVPAAAVVVGLIVLAVESHRFGYVLQGMSLIVVFGLCAGLPIMVAFTFGALPDLWAAGWSAQLLGRLAQTALISIAALLPPLLYFIFDRQRALTVRRNFQKQIMRFDRRVTNVYDLEARYGDLLHESVGGSTSQDARMRRTNPYPIFVASAVITLGWTLVMPVVDTGPLPLQAYLTPAPTSLAFGFLGAYFFALNLLARRFVRGDLRPKAYATVTVRVIVVLILCWVLDTFATPDAWLLVTAFLIGIVPETFFTLVSELRRSLSKAISESLREPHPLTNLEGIDLYDRSRLEDEGVNNVEALAHHDLVELMLATRVPVARLIDWVDQAILYLHTVDEKGNSISRDALRGAGIRTASDLRAVGKSADLPAVLAKLCNGGWGSREQLDLVLRVIDDEEWMVNVLEWHKDPAPRCREYVVRNGNLHEVGEA